MVDKLTLTCSDMDTTRPRVRHPQILHLHPCAIDGGCDAQSGQDTERLGLGHWEEEAEEFVSERRVVACPSHESHPVTSRAVLEVESEMAGWGGILQRFEEEEDMHATRLLCSTSICRWAQSRGKWLRLSPSF